MSSPYEHYGELKARGIDLAEYEPEHDWKRAFSMRLLDVVMNSKSLDGLLAASGVSSSTFDNWVQGTAAPDAFKVAKIASYLDVSLDWLMLGDRFDKFVVSGEIDG